MNILRNKLAGYSDMLRKLWILVQPFGTAKALAVLVIVLVQGILQVAGVTSVFPFLALAADPNSIRSSGFGSRVLSHLPPMDNQQLLLWAGVLSILMLVISNVANLFSDYARARYAHGLGHFLRLRLLEKLSSRPWRYFLGQNTGVLLKKTTWDVGNTVNQVVLPILEGTARLVTAVFLVATLVALSPKIAVVAAFVLAIYYAVVFVVLQRSRRRLSHAARDADRGAFREAQQLLAGIKTVKIHSVESFFVERFARHSLVQARVSSKLPLHYQAPKYILEPIAFGGLILAVIIYAASGHNLNQIIPALGVIGFAGYRLLPAMQLLYAAIAQIGTNRHALDEIYQEFSGDNAEELDNQTKLSLQDRLEPMQLDHEIRFDDVCFQYDSAAKLVLNHVNLSIRKRTSVGIVGPTGSGKSTLVDILMGLHVPTAGRLLVDGCPLTEENTRFWQAGIGYVPQEIFLIDDTVARNIALGVRDEHIDMHRVREAASAASILDFIQKDLPGGFQSIVGERGVRLSGGQRQRIALARALYRKPQLLILDEATSALDNETEAQVVEAINNLQGEVTIVVVAHRLSTVERCDFLIDLGGVAAE